MVSATSIPQTGTHHLIDDGPPSKLGVRFAKFGDLQMPQPQRTTYTRVADPLVLLFDNVEPGTRLEVLNLSKQPDADWTSKDAIKTLPGETLKPLGDGRYGLVLSNDAAKAVGIDPGDVFEVRQVDGAENASPETRVYLNQKGTEQINFGQAGTVDYVGVTVPGGNRMMRVAPYADAFAPLVLTGNMKIEPSKEDGKAVLSGKRAIEPGATVFVHNEATHQTFNGKVGEDRTFEVTFDAKPGHPLHVYVDDHNGVRTDLGLTPYAPKTVKGGPLAAALLQQATAAAAE